MKKKIVVLGAGISGLAAAHWLSKKNINLTILEKENVAGGTMESEIVNGFLFERGPNSALETTPLIRQIAEETDVADKLISANDEANKRYILRNDKLHPLPTSLPAFIKTKLFSTKGKLRLFAEPFIGKSKDGYYQSIAQFVRRRLGVEFLDYAINPFVAGVFAGNPEELSVKSSFPKLYALEENYGGLIKGMLKGARERKKRNEVSKQNAKMISFKNGIRTLPEAIAFKLNDSIIYSAEIKKVIKTNGSYTVTYLKEGKENSINADIVLSTLPSYIAATIFSELDGTLSKHLESIYYPPVLVLYLVYDKKDVGQQLDGFGFLIPEKEGKSFLGALWSSIIFDERKSERNASFTLFIGGARSPHLFELDGKDLIEKVLTEFHSIMRISNEPLFISERFWDKAIPQYNIGHIEHEKYFEQFEKKYRGIVLSGNYRGGISVGDCIKNSKPVAERVLQLI